MTAVSIAAKLVPISEAGREDKTTRHNKAYKTRAVCANANKAINKTEKASILGDNTSAPSAEISFLYLTNFF